MKYYWIPMQDSKQNGEHGIVCQNLVMVSIYTNTGPICQKPQDSSIYI